ncbi:MULTISPECIES: hypothetical protein [unclassified Tatumella]|uniref:hypothetical protein n=1 Tax=unclassified Tatumella TaxID=2649542 RepID=UPI001BAF81F5|nr:MULTISPECIES: hypothetical protein [unclassified Tatumella]MBS0857245.1 hypothetical protein [Tatumella sp. JGM16]MBS0913998.1 hypothetical protein [Tatumella sp. JGM91]
MEKSTLDLIFRVCRKEREYLLTKPPSLTMFNPSPFPKGWCGESARRIQDTLRRSGIDAEYREGDAFPERTDRMNHAWLEYDGYFIDITADQFNDQGYSNDPIMVTTDNSFHKIFKLE